MEEDYNFWTRSVDYAGGVKVFELGSLLNGVPTEEILGPLNEKCNLRQKMFENIQ